MWISIFLVFIALTRQESLLLGFDLATFFMEDIPQLFLLYFTQVPDNPTCSCRAHEN